MATARDEFVGPLVLAGLGALGRLAPRRDRVATTRGAAFATAQRVIDRVHRNTANRRHATLPAIAPGLADILVGMVGIRHRANGREAVLVDQALLARIQAENGVALLTSDVLGVSAGRAGELTARPRLQLDVV